MRSLGLFVFLLLFCLNSSPKVFADIVIEISGSPGSADINVSISGTISPTPLFIGGINSFSFFDPTGTFYEGPFNLLANNNLSVQNITTGSPAGTSQLIDFHNATNSDSIRLLFLSPTVSGAQGDLFEFRGSELFTLGNNATFDDFTVGSYELTTSANYSGSITLNVTIDPEFVLPGDCNQDGVVDFFDISTFAVSLTTGVYLEPADINQSGEVTFLDIAPFIAILAGR